MAGHADRDGELLLDREDARTPGAAISSTSRCSAPPSPSSPTPSPKWTVAGVEQRRLGNGSASRKPTASRFRAGDGFIADARADPRVADWPSRTANEQALSESIAAALATDDLRSREPRLTAADLACGSVRRITTSSTTRRPPIATRAQTIDVHGELLGMSSAEIKTLADEGAI